MCYEIHSLSHVFDQNGRRTDVSNERFPEEVFEVEKHLALDSRHVCVFLCMINVLDKKHGLQQKQF
jgi:hypothetical protein